MHVSYYYFYILQVKLTTAGDIGGDTRFVRFESEGSCIGGPALAR